MKIGALRRFCMALSLAAGHLWATCGGMTVCTTLEDFDNCVDQSNTTCTMSNSSTVSVTATITVTGSNLTIQGQGSGATRTKLERSSTSVDPLLSVSPSSTGITITNLRFDGNNSLWNWSASHANLKSFLESGNYYHDVAMSTANGITLQYCAFLNSGRVAVYFQGRNITISNNTFDGGLDNAIFAYNGNTGSNPNFTISNNTIENYRGAGINLNGMSYGSVTQNSLTYNANGDVDGQDKDSGYVGAGQIYIRHTSNTNVSSNWIDGAYWNGYAAPYPAGGQPNFVNYGIEIDATPGGTTVSNNTFSNNTLSNHGIAGYWIGGPATGTSIDDETVTYNRIQGVIVADGTSSSGSANTIIKSGSSLSNNGGSGWYNGASLPTGYGLYVSGSQSSSVCYESGVTLSSNSSGAACQESGASCSGSPTQYVTKATCP